MTTRPARNEVRIADGVHLLRAQNHETAVVALVVRDGRLEIWLRLYEGRGIADASTQWEAGE